MRRSWFRVVDGRHAVACLLAGVLLATGCTGSPDDPEPAPAGSGDRATDMVACLQDLGWEVEVQPDNSYLAGVPNEQLDQFEADEAQCRQRLDVGEVWQPLNEAEAEAYYDAMLEAADCIRALGYHVDDPPSRETAIEAIQQPIVDLGWDPYRDPELNAGSLQEVEDLHAACPRPILPR